MKMDVFEYCLNFNYCYHSAIQESPFLHINFSYECKTCFLVTNNYYVEYLYVLVGKHSWETVQSSLFYPK